MKKQTSRFAAIEILLQLERTRLPVSPIIDRVTLECSLNQADRHLTMKICYGVLRQRDYLNHLLSLLCRQPVKRIKPFAYQALLVGLYQLFFLDRIPPSAAVNETVNAVKSARLPKPVQGFVNGVLRESLRRKKTLPAPGQPIKPGHIFLNHPSWLTKKWSRQYGPEVMQQICSANNHEAVTCLRISSRTTVNDYLATLKENKIAARPGRYAPDSIILENFQGSITLLPGFHDGLFQVQDQSAQLATTLLGPFDDGDTYLDCCAGVGGKTMSLVSLVNLEKCRITALEPSPARFRQLTENLLRTGTTDKISVHNETLERYSRSCMTRFDKILIDAPCSGTGVIGRHPDIRWNRKEQDIIMNQNKQLTLLELAAKLLIPGGIMVYATCSIEPEENDAVVDRFLQANQNFSLTDSREYLPQAAHELTRGYFFSPIPSRETDGFFTARFVAS